VTVVGHQPCAFRALDCRWLMADGPATTNLQEKHPMSQTLEFTITGMTCEHCVHAVATAAKDTPGVTDAQVSLDEKRAVVTGENIDPEAAIAAIKEEGYEAALA
jgi:copper chaperone